MRMVDPRVRTAQELLLGYRRGRSVSYIAYGALIAALAYVVAAAAWGGVAVFGFERFRATAPPMLLGVAGLGALLALLHGYTNDGVLVGVAVALAPFVGLLLWGATAVGLALPSPEAGQAGLDERALLGAIVGGCLALLGTAVGRLTSSDRARNVREETPTEAADDSN
jgi:hypothetical protein